jgi:hypothetical protein
MLYLDNSKHVRVYTSSAEGCAIPKRRIQLFTSWTSRNMATCPVSRFNAYALLTTMHQRTRDVGS